MVFRQLVPTALQSFRQSTVAQEIYSPDRFAFDLFQFFLFQHVVFLSGDLFNADPLEVSTAGQGEVHEQPGGAFYGHIFRGKRERQRPECFTARDVEREFERIVRGFHFAQVGFQRSGKLVADNESHFVQFFGFESGQTEVKLYAGFFNMKP